MDDETRAIIETRIEVLDKLIVMKELQREKLTGALSITDTSIKSLNDGKYELNKLLENNPNSIIANGKEIQIKDIKTILPHVIAPACKPSKDIHQ